MVDAIAHCNTNAPNEEIDKHFSESCFCEKRERKKERDLSFVLLLRLGIPNTRYKDGPGT